MTGALQPLPKQRDEQLLSSQVPPSPGEPLVVIVVVNYNGCADVQYCLRSLARLNYARFQLLVIDSCSSPDEREKVEHVVRRAGHYFMALPENLGFAAANNIGLRYAAAAEADYVWLLNPDTVVGKDSLLELVAYAELTEEPVVCGSKVYYGALDGDLSLAAAAAFPDLPENPRIWSCGGTLDKIQRKIWMNGWNEEDNGQFAEPRDCDYLPGCSMFLPLSLLPKIGSMPEEYFLYFEETEWCAQMEAEGIRRVCVPRSVVWHRFEDKKLQGASKVYYYNRNELLFWWRRLRRKERPAYICNILFKKLPEIRKALRNAPNENMRDIFRAHRRACLDFLRGRFGQ
jgi:GT2 family glycosyltransferase